MQKILFVQLLWLLIRQRTSLHTSLQSFKHAYLPKQCFRFCLHVTSKARRTWCVNYLRKVWTTAFFLNKVPSTLSNSSVFPTESFQTHMQISTWRIPPWWPNWMLKQIYDIPGFCGYAQSNFDKAFYVSLFVFF